MWAFISWFHWWDAAGDPGSPTVTPGSGNLFWKIYRKRRG